MTAPAWSPVDDDTADLLTLVRNEGHVSADAEWDTYCAALIEVAKRRPSAMGQLEQIRGITGRIDLVHANDSRDAAGSGADRHTSLGAGQIPADELADVIRAAGAPVMLETPGQDLHAADLAWLREHL